MAEWINVKDRLPSDGQYLICYKLNTKPQSYVFHVARFAKNLHEVDEYDFDRKDVSGFYDYDSEWGYFKYQISMDLLSRDISSRLMDMGSECLTTSTHQNNKGNKHWKRTLWVP